MAAKNEFWFCENSHVNKIWKTTFTKEFFNKIWFKVGEHKYIYIFEIKFEKSYSAWKWRSNEVLSIYAN